MWGGLHMLISLRDKNNKLIVKDYFDLDFDMSVFEANGKYYVSINKHFCLNDEFTNEGAAEEAMLMIMNARNTLEQEIRNY